MINKVDLKITSGAATYDANGTPTLSTGGKYEALVYSLSGADAAKVTSFKFFYENGLIKYGYVVINSSYYVLHQDGSWSGQATVPTADDYK